MNVISELKVCIIPLMSSESADVISDDHEYVSCNYSAVSGTSVWSSNLGGDFVPRGSSRGWILGGGRSGGRGQKWVKRHWILGQIWGSVGSRRSRPRVRFADLGLGGQSVVKGWISISLYCRVFGRGARFLKCLLSDTGLDLH